MFYPTRLDRLEIASLFVAGEVWRLNCPLCYPTSAHSFSLSMRWKGSVMILRGHEKQTNSPSGSKECGALEVHVNCTWVYARARATAHCKNVWWRLRVTFLPVALCVWMSSTNGELQRSWCCHEGGPQFSIWNESNDYFSKNVVFWFNFSVVMDEVVKTWIFFSPLGVCFSFISWC